MGIMGIIIYGHVNQPTVRPANPTHPPPIPKNKNNTPTHLQQRLPVPRGHRKPVRLPDAPPRLEPLLHRHGRAPLVLRLLRLLLLRLGLFVCRCILG